jgi:hypothetical protein
VDSALKLGVGFNCLGGDSDIRLIGGGLECDRKANSPRPAGDEQGFAL